MKFIPLIRASLLLALLPIAHSYAGSATWNLNPTSGVCTNSANWTPASYPNGPLDIATFGVSNTTSITASAIQAAEIKFEAGANWYSIGFNGEHIPSAEQG